MIIRCMISTKTVNHYHGHGPRTFLLISDRRLCDESAFIIGYSRFTLHTGDISLSQFLMLYSIRLMRSEYGDSYAVLIFLATPYCDIECGLRSPDGDENRNAFAQENNSGGTLHTPYGVRGSLPAAYRTRCCTPTRLRNGTPTVG